MPQVCRFLCDQQRTDPRTRQTDREPEPGVTTGADCAPRYTDKLIKRVIIQGCDAERKRLSWVMPRWHMTDQERDDLLAGLKTLT